MDKQKISKILIITSIATGVTLSGAFLIYKHNKENKQYKRNSHSNFSITIHLSKDQVHNTSKKGEKGKDHVENKPEEEVEEDEEEIQLDEEELNKLQDFDDYLAQLPPSSPEEKNFFLNLFDKFIHIFSSEPEEDTLANDTVIITKPNEALTSLDDTAVELDDNNDTIIITKPNEASELASPLEGPSGDIKILNDVISQTIHMVNSSGSESEDHGNLSTASTSTARDRLSRKNFNKKMRTTAEPESTSSHFTATGPVPVQAPSTSTSTTSSSSTLIDKQEGREEDLQNTSLDASYTTKLYPTETEIIRTAEDEDEDDYAHDAEEEDNASDLHFHSNSNSSLTYTPVTSRRQRRKETITSFNYKNSPSFSKRYDDNDSETDGVAPSTPKMNFADFPTPQTHTPKMKASATATMTSTPNATPARPSLGATPSHSDSVNPLSIDINKILMGQPFEFSDEEEEEEEAGHGQDDLDLDFLSGQSGSSTSGRKTLHRASSISSTSTWQSAKSSWTEGHRMDDAAGLTNDEKWEVNSACSSTSGFYSAQEDFFDPVFE